jgi:hypothetical protein
MIASYPAHKQILAILVGCTLSIQGFCQQHAGKDVQDWLVENRWIRSRHVKDNFLLLLPVIGANPSAGFIYGGGLTYAYTSELPNARASNISSNVSYSTKGLMNLNIKSNLFSIRDRLFLNGDWRFFIISETTYGLGSSTKNTGQRLRYDFSRFHETASWRIIRNFFAGIGIHYDRQFKIYDNTADTAAVRSYHYNYSIQHNFNPVQYTMSGFSINLIYDSRDNPINAYKGQFVNLNYRINNSIFGSTQNSSIFFIDYRAFLPVGDIEHHNVFAFWIYANSVASGNVPYLMLPAIGYDQRQKSGRGYAFGRFRGESMVYGETEYRFSISRRTGILGGVIFSNFVTTTNRNAGINLFEYIQPAYGAGLRLLLDKISRTRLQLDGAMGGGRPTIYFGIRETF